MPRESTRSKLLDAGMAVLIEDGMGVLSRGMTLQPVMDKAGVSHSTVHRHYPRPSDDIGKAKFIDELVVALATSPSPVADKLTGVITDSFTKAKGDPRRVIRDVCNWDFATIREHDSVLHALAALVLARRHRKAMSSLRMMYRKYDGLIIAGIEAVLAKWGASLRKPFTQQLLALTLTAIVEGLTLRWLASPEDVPDELFGDIIVALAASVFDVDQSHQHIDDVAAPLARAVMQQFQMAQLDNLPANPRKAVIDAASNEFDRRGYFATSLAHISASAHVPIDVLKKIFPNKADIVIGGLLGPLKELEEKVADDVTLQRSEIDIVRRHLSNLAQFAKQNRVMTGALLAVVAHDAAQSPETATRVKQELDLPGVITAVIETGQEKGSFTTTTPPYELAAVLTNTLLRRCFARPTDQAEEIAATIASIFLDGILVRQ